MLTQQKLLDRLNQLTVHYNLSWYDILYDADKAIAKINSFMGTCYPKLSSHMTHPNATYSVRSEGIDIEIFPEEYIHSIVIPYIAMEVLARDEEFTTVYNKYNMEVEDGLFNMFQKEFNRVPFVFRQNPDQGVFFAADTLRTIDPTTGAVGSSCVLCGPDQNRYAPLGISHNKRDVVPAFKFHVYYDINESNIVLSSLTSHAFTNDPAAYEYKDIARVLAGEYTLLSHDGSRAYEFVGWLRNPADTEVVPEDTPITMISDVRLYARWNVVNTLNCINGVVTIKSEYAGMLVNLVIPATIEGVTVTTIPTDFVKNSPNLITVQLPSYLTNISTNAFKDFRGTSIVFAETPIRAVGYAGCTIATNAFDATPTLTSIILPANVVVIAAGAFPIVANRSSLTINCRVVVGNKPLGWEDGWYGETGITVVWGYNG